MKDLILEVRNITKEVNSPEGLLTIVKDINLSVEKGKPISLVGPSGSGKTTLVSHYGGFRSSNSRICISHGFQYYFDG